jgi:CRISPR-associated protein Cmr2
LFAGKVIYAGGDDVLAMLPVDDVLPALLVLRCAYSGVMPASDRTMNWMLRPDGEEVRVALTRIGNGFVRIGGENGRLFRMMGRFATASAGAVIAHHKTPLQGVLRELRAAEKRAKDEGGRNAFSIALMKRAGGTTHFTAGFGFGGKGWEPAADDPTALGVLFQFRDTLATEGVSRRAAYNVIAWLPDFPARPNEELAPDALGEMLRRSIAWQLGRQGVTTRTGFPKGFAEKLASGLVAVADMEAGKRGDSFSYTAFLSDLVTVAEFLAREGRALPPPREEQQEGKRRREEGGAQ